MTWLQSELRVEYLKHITSISKITSTDPIHYLYEDALKCFEDIINGSSVSGIPEADVMYAKVLHTRIRYEKARVYGEIYRRQCNPAAVDDPIDCDDPTQCVYAAYHFALECGYERKYEEAKRVLQPFAKENSRLAQYGMGIIFLAEASGVSLTSKPESKIALYDAIGWLEKSASQSFIRAQYQLGHINKRGLPICAPDRDRAMHFFELAAAQGHADSQCEFALLKLDENTTLGIGLLEQAIAQGNIRAMHDLGCHYVNNKQQEEKGVQMIEQVARDHYQQMPMSLHNMGHIWRLGWGGKQPNPRKAHQCYSLAAKYGIKESMGYIEQRKKLEMKFYTFCLCQHNNIVHSTSVRMFIARDVLELVFQHMYTSSISIYEYSG